MVDEEIKQRMEEFGHELVISRDNEDSPNVTIDIDDKGMLKITVNSFKMFSTLHNRTQINVGLHKMLEGILQKHLKSKANQETELRKQR